MLPPACLPAIDQSTNGLFDVVHRNLFRLLLVESCKCCAADSENISSQSSDKDEHNMIEMADLEWMM